MNKEQKKPQEDWETEFNEKFGTGNLVSECPHGWDTEKVKDIKDHIRSDFIAKRDLRKLLEGKKKQLSQYDDDEKGLYDDAWNYNLTIDDILAEIEKL